MPLRIEDYALIGDCETAALVGRDGSIDWLCLPRFDSDCCFAALLGEPKNGRWIIAPEGNARVSRQYRGDTLILETTFKTSEGSVLLVDFMPPKGSASDVMRLVIGVDGLLTHAPSHLPPPEVPDAFAALEDTERFWNGWSATCTGAGRWSRAVLRSLITLKALTFAPTGGIVAASTISLPEKIGGQRNWDYRFCWVRDATLTLLALMGAGYFQEASAWRDWLGRAVAGSPAQLQIMYGIAGERRLWEREVPWLDGYESSKPVRIGNAAHAQFQLDVFGEMMDALYQARRGGLPESEPTWAVECALLGHLASTWREPDNGMWETRGERRHFTYSKMMAWVAFDRAIKSAQEFGLPGPVDEWQRHRGEIHDEVCRMGYDDELGHFVQAYGSKELDASLLLIPAIGFLPPVDPRVAATVAAIERHLLVDGFVRRYDTGKSDDGLPTGEGAFLACSFWLADAYYLLGRTEEAEQLFERLLGLCNDVGLLSEEYDPRQKRLLGNFPQAFSHISLVNTAHNLSHANKPAEQRAGK